MFFVPVKENTTRFVCIPLNEWNKLCDAIEYAEGDTIKEYRSSHRKISRAMYDADAEKIHVIQTDEKSTGGGE